jgi:hypothetical protein
MFSSSSPSAAAVAALWRGCPLEKYHTFAKECSTTVQ